MGENPRIMTTAFPFLVMLLRAIFDGDCDGGDLIFSVVAASLHVNQMLRLTDVRAGTTI